MRVVVGEVDHDDVDKDHARRLEELFSDQVGALLDRFCLKDDGQPCSLALAKGEPPIFCEGIQGILFELWRWGERDHERADGHDDTFF